MKQKFWSLAIAAALAAAISPLSVHAQAVPPTAATPVPATAPTTTLPASDRVTGRVTALDTTKNTITVANRREGTSTTLAIAPDVKVLMTQPAAVTDIKVGDTVQAYGAATPETPTLTADRLEVVQPTTSTKTGPKAGFHKRYVEGVVATTTPALTMKTAGGVTVTVTPSADARVTRVSPGTLAGVAVGANVQLRTNGDATTPTVTELRVMPARERRKTAE